MVDNDLSAFKEILATCRDMEMENSKTNNLLQEMDKLYWMDWDEEGTVKEKMENVKVTRSPLARNSIQGAMRLLTASDPEISVPHDTNNTLAASNSSKLEKFLKAMWFTSGRYSGDPLHYDATRSALLYSEVIIAINSTKEMAKMSNIPAVKRRMEDISKKTPYLFEVWSPLTCQTRRDKYGITQFHRKIKTTIAHVQDVYGAVADPALRSNKNKKTINRSDQVDFNLYYDLRYVCIWLDGYELPIKLEEHNLPFIPIVSQLVEGSSLFDVEKYYRQEPFLYTLYKTKLVDRQSLILTTLYTMLFSIGANPMFVDFLINPDSPHPVDYSVPGGTIHYRMGERREPMAKQVIDPSMMQGWEISKELESQSTIYKQTLGEPLGMNAPYSMVALLSQSGRLPLIASQRKIGWAIGEAMEIALRWMKFDNRSGRAKYEQLEEEISPDDIPDDVDVNVQLEINTPSDRLQAANAANMLTQGEDPLVSKRWSRENILLVGQSEDMDKEIWTEKSMNIFFQKFLYDQLAKLSLAKQQAMMPGNASGMPGMPAGQPPMPPMPNMPPTEEGMIQAGTPPQPTSPEFVEPEEPYPPMPPLQPGLTPR